MRKLWRERSKVLQLLLSEERGAMLATTAAAAAAGSRRSAAAGAKAVVARQQVAGAARCKSAVAAASSESVKTFKIYRWDPNEKVRHRHDRHRQRSVSGNQSVINVAYSRTATFPFMTGLTAT